MIGGGHAAGQLLDSVRREGYRGDITLVTDEGSLPYQRPHLSKLYLAGALHGQKLLYRPESFYDDKEIAVILNRRVENIDRDNKEVTLEDGKVLKYSRLALTTGARVRRLNIPGAEQQGAYYLRTVEDTNRIRIALAEANNVLVIGGGFLGLEIASVATGMNKKVTVLEVQDRIMAGVVAPEISEFYRRVHSTRGVKILTGVQANEIHSEDCRLSAVTTVDGSSLSADMVLIGVGITPNEELAAAAGLKCDNGICVDEYATTADPDIVAAGDCTNHPNGFLNKNVRLESVHNAVEQAKTAAASLCGKQKSYRQIPWFWSDQYKYRLQMAGIPGPNDRRIVRGAVAQGSFSVLFFSKDGLTACHAVNTPDDYVSCRKILENSIRFTPEQAADPSFYFRSIIPAKAALAFQRR